MLTIRSLSIFNPVTFFCGGVSRHGVRRFGRIQKSPFFFTGPVDNRQRPPAPPVFKSPYYNSQRPRGAAGETVRHSRKLQVSRAVFVEIPPMKANQPTESISGSYNTVGKSVSRSPTFNRDHRFFDTRETMLAYRARKSYEKEPTSEPVTSAESSIADNFSSTLLSSTRYTCKQGEKFNIRKIQEALRAISVREDGSASKPVNGVESPVADNFFRSPVSSTHHQGDRIESLSQQAIDIIVNDLQTSGSWNNIAGEIALKAVTDLPSWPKNKHLQVNYQTVNDCSSWILEYGKQAATNPIILQLQSSHYEPVVEGRKVAVAGDGNCFYHSLLLALSVSEQQQLLGTAFIPHDRKSVADDRVNPNMTALRQFLASHVQKNPSLISAYLTEQCLGEEQIIQEAEAAAKAQQVAGDAAWAQKLQADEAAALAKALQADDFLVSF